MINTNGFGSEWSKSNCMILLGKCPYSLRVSGHTISSGTACNDKKASMMQFALGQTLWDDVGRGSVMMID